MSSKMVIGIFDDYEQATRAIEGLRKGNFRGEDISLLGPDPEELRMVGAEFENKHPDKVVTTCGILGALGGFTLGMASLTIPGVGVFLAVGPLMAALSGAAAGGMIGVIAGELIKFDVPEFDAHLYEAHLSAGNILISVHTENHDQRVLAEDILEESGAVTVSTKREPVAAK